MSRQTLTFKVRYDPTSGAFQLEVQPDLWTAPIEIDRVARIVKSEYFRRQEEGAPPKGLLAASTILAEALLNAPQVKRIPAKGNRAEKSKLEVDELAALLGI